MYKTQYTTSYICTCGLNDRVCFIMVQQNFIHDSKLET